MIITLSNQKGGVGKSLVAILLADYFSKNNNVTILDIDPQQTIVTMRQDDISIFPDYNYTYEVVPISILDLNENNIEKIISDIKNISNEGVIVIIDLAGDIYNPFVAYFLLCSDFIVTPFNYEAFILRSTAQYLLIIKKLLEENKSNIPVILVPNKMLKKTRKEDEPLRQEINEIFSQYGTIVAPIRQAIDITRLKTRPINGKFIKEYFLETLEEINKIVMNK